MKQLLCLSCLLLFSLLSIGQLSQTDTVYSGTVKDKFVITIRKPAEGDAQKVNAAPDNQPVAQDHNLQLESFRTYPNPTQGQVTVEFRAEPVATVVTLYDMSGRQLFREELNAFSGDYNQQFDLSEYAKGNIVVHVQQAEKVFTEQIVIN